MKYLLILSLFIFSCQSQLDEDTAILESPQGVASNVNEYVSPLYIVKETIKQPLVVNKQYQLYIRYRTFGTALFTGADQNGYTEIVRLPSDYTDELEFTYVFTASQTYPKGSAILIAPTANSQITIYEFTVTLL